MLPDRIKKLRLAKHMSQTELAQKTGSSSAMISLIEAGKKKPTLELLTKLCEVLESSSDYILIGKESTNEISPDEREIIEILRQDDALTRAIKEAAELKKKVIRRIRMAIEPERLAA